MIFPIALLIPVAASFGCFLWFRDRAAGAKYWQTASKVAGIVAALRIGCVALGVYFLEYTSGWLQLPGYAMALCGLPELYLMPKPTWGAPEGLARLAALNVLGSAAWTFALAGLAARARRPGSQVPFPNALDHKSPRKEAP